MTCAWRTRTDPAHSAVMTDPTETGHLGGGGATVSSLGLVDTWPCPAQMAPTDEASARQQR